MSLRKLFVNFLAEQCVNVTSKLSEMMHTLTINLYLNRLQTFAKMFAGENFLIS